MEEFVKRAVTVIRQRYNEPLCLDELARAAMTSKFHFLRSFRCLTGVTPGRFLCAVRLYEAKRLLSTTSLRVIDVSMQVGYGSIGTFTRRFTESVGLPPNQYRRMAHGEEVPNFRARGRGRTLSASGSIVGTLRTTSMPLSTIYLGAFEGRITQGPPVACISADSSGPFRIDVPVGSWYLNAVALAEPASGVYGLAGLDLPLLVDAVGPMQVSPYADACVNLTLGRRVGANPQCCLPCPALTRRWLP